MKIYLIERTYTHTYEDLMCYIIINNHTTPITSCATTPQCNLLVVVYYREYLYQITVPIRILPLQTGFKVLNISNTIVASIDWLVHASISSSYSLLQLCIGTHKLCGPTNDYHKCIHSEPDALPAEFLVQHDDTTILLMQLNQILFIK